MSSKEYMKRPVLLMSSIHKENEPMAEISEEKYKTSGIQIVRNSVFLYLRQILIMLVGLIAVRVTLRTLGAEDYGVYNVVAGSVTLFSFLVGAVGVGAQRFFSFYIGKGDKEQLTKVFTNTFTIYLALAFTVLVFTEGIGMYLLNNKLIIPDSRIAAARIVFQLSCISLFFNIMQAPFIALVVAHENMKIFAQLGIYDAVAKLLLVFLLIVIPGDKLVVYAALSLVVVLSCSIFYQKFCCHHYEECKLKIAWERRLSKEILSYNGWNLWGQFASVMKNQGLSIMLNTFYGPVVNAAVQVASQVRGLCVTLSNNFTAAVNPQIIKSYSANDNDRLFRLAFGSAKLNFILMLLLILPMTFHVDYLLHLWLGEIPDWTIIICRLMLIDSLAEVASAPFATINQATGKIGLYQFVLGLIGLMNLPFAYIALYYNASPSLVFVIGIIIQVIIAVIRVLFVNRVKKNTLWQVLMTVYFPCTVVLFVSYLGSYLTIQPAEGMISLCFYSVVQMLFVLMLSFVLVFNKEERAMIKNILASKFNRK